MTPLLKNAVVSIQLGLEDFASDDERRIISAARNLHSGVLLMLPHVPQNFYPILFALRVDEALPVYRSAGAGSSGFEAPPSGGTGEPFMSVIGG